MRLSVQPQCSPCSKFLRSCFPEQLFGNGFAACCEDAALPFPKSAPLILGCALAFESEGTAQTVKGLDTEGQSRILTTGGKAEAIIFGCGSAALRLCGERFADKDSPQRHRV